MARGGKVRVDVEMDAKGVERGVADAERSLDRLERSGRRALGALKTAGIATGAALGAGLAAAVITGVRELREAEEAMAQTEARLKSTGGAANVTAKEVEGLASALQAQTGVADDVIQGGANLLLTFTNIRNEAGKGNDVFTQATKSSLDLSVAFKQDLQSSALMVGKALNDPIRGITALGRAGVQFTDQQKDQIRTLVESNRTLDAQKIILGELNKQVGGSALAMGNTTSGQIERVKRAWEDVSQELVVQFMPLITRVAQGVLDNMDKVRGFFRGLANAARGFVDFFSALFRGDWKKAWDLAVTGAGKALRAIGTIIEKVVLPLAKKAGEAIASGLISGVESGLRKVPGGMAIGRLFGLFPGSETTVRDFNFAGTAAGIRGVGEALAGISIGAPSRARGGGVPGRPGQAVPIIAHAGEVVLNPTQQRIIGIDRIISTLRRTGGVVGGDNFAAGGIVGGSVAAARARAVSNLGEPYGKPSRGESRTGPNSWDCSGFATMVAGVNVGGTTASAFGASSPAKGTEPVVWGFRKSHGGGYRGGYDEHMGVRVGGIWYQTSNGRTAQTGSDGDWQEIRVPRGLENLRDGDGPGGEAARGSGRATPKPLFSTAVARLLKLATGQATSGVSESLAGSSLTAGQTRGVAAAGRRAAREAMAGGRSPDEVSDVRIEAERKAEERALGRNLDWIQGAIAKLRTHKAKLVAELNRLARDRKATRKKAKARRLRAGIAAVTSEIRELLEMAAEVNARLAEIGDERVLEQYQEDYDAATAASDAAEEPGAEVGPTPDQQAQVDQANARATAAENERRASDAFLSAFRGSGDIDPAAGVTINQYVQGSVVMESQAASWLVEAMNRQGNRTASVSRSGA